MTVAAYRLPDNISRGVAFGPDFRSIVQESLAGNEQRFIQWAKCRGRGDLKYGIRSQADLDKVNAIFLAHFGKVYPVRMKVWSDFKATDERFGTGNGSANAFQLIKTYDPGLLLLGSSGSLKYIRTINFLVGAPVIKDNGTIKTVTTDYTISSTALVTFTSPPTNTHALTWTGEFDYLVRADSDHLANMMQNSRYGEIGSIPIREVVGET